MRTWPSPVSPADYAARWPRCSVDPTAVVYDNVALGEGVVVGPLCVLGYPGGIRGAETFSGTVRIGAGTRLGVGVVVTAGTEGETVIGERCLVMNRANVGHNARVGDDVEIGAGAVVCGWAEVGGGARVKVGALVRNRKRVGPGAVVGMGANVVSDVPSGAVVYGNPARPYNGRAPIEPSTIDALHALQAEMERSAGLYAYTPVSPAFVARQHAEQRRRIRRGRDYGDGTEGV